MKTKTLDQLIHKNKRTLLTPEERERLIAERINLIVKGADWSEIFKVIKALNNN